MSLTWKVKISHHEYTSASFILSVSLMKIAASIGDILFTLVFTKSLKLIFYSAMKLVLFLLFKKAISFVSRMGYSSD